MESGLLLGAARHEDHMALDGGQGLQRTVYQGGHVALREHGRQRLAQRGADRLAQHGGEGRREGRHGFFAVHAHHDVGDVALAHHARDGVHDVHVVAQQAVHVHVGRRRGRGRHVEDAPGAFLHLGVVRAVVHGVEGVEAAVAQRRGADAQADQFVHARGVGQRDEHVLARGGLLVVVRASGGDVVGAALRGEGRYGARGEDHQDGAVQHALVQQADRLAVGRVAQYDVVAHHDGRERGRHVGAAQAEEQCALVAREAERLLREHGREVLGQCDADDHGGAHLDRLPVLEEGAVVDQHAHADQEEGDEYGVAYEFDAVHEGRGARDERIHGQSGQEGPDDGFEPRQLGQESPEEDHDQHEDVLRHAVGAAAEEPVADERKEQQDDRHAQHHGDSEAVPESRVGAARGRAHDDGEHQQGEHVGDDRAAHGERHGFVARDAQLAHDGVGHERLRGEQPGQQHRRVDREAEDEVAHGDAHEHRDREGVEPEHQAVPPRAPEVGRVHLQPREEHDVEESGRARENDAAVAQHEVQAVGADDGAGDDEPQQVGHLELVEQQGRGQHDGHDEHELQDGVFERQLDGCVCEERKHGVADCLYANIIKIVRKCKPARILLRGSI